MHFTCLLKTQLNAKDLNGHGLKLHSVSFCVGYVSNIIVQHGQCATGENFFSEGLFLVFFLQSGIMRTGVFILSSWDHVWIISLQKRSK